MTTEYNISDYFFAWFIKTEFIETQKDLKFELRSFRTRFSMKTRRNNNFHQIWRQLEKTPEKYK